MNNQDTKNQTAPTTPEAKPSAESKKFKPFKGRFSWRSPGVIVFAVLFAAIGGYIIFNSYAAGPQSPIRIIAGYGGNNITDSKGNTWTKETGYFTGGKTYSVANNIDIANTTDDNLFRNSRSGTNGGTFSYNFKDLENGTYNVKLYLAELWNDQYGTNCTAGKRTFSVTGNSTPILTNFSIYNTAGCRTAYITPGTNVTVSNGTLSLNFTRGNSGSDPNPMVNAIEIVPVDTSPPADSIKPSASITAPTNGSTIQGSVNILASATDNVAVSKVEISIDNGAPIVLTSSPYSYSWDSTKATNGSHTITARSYDAAGNVSDTASYTVTVNNSTTTPPPTTGVNLALNRPASALSTSTSAGQPSSAFDGSLTTRWSSSYSQPQWLQVDLGAAYSITGVKLNWEAAYGKAYSIQVSNDGTNWTSIYSTTAGDGGTDDLTGLSGTGRYVRMNGTTRATVGGTQYGFSLWEMAVYGTGTTTTPPAGDTEKPTVPGGLTASAFSDTQVQLNWNDSTDNVGVTKYNIYRDGSATSIGNTSRNDYLDSGLAAYSSHTYTVEACDAAGNCSNKTASVSIRTKDLSLPTVPGNVTANGTSSSAVSVTWSASTDTGSGLSGYSVYRNGTRVANNISATSFSDSGLSASTTYSYVVEACDKASPANCVQSSAAAGTTQTAADTTPPTAPGNFKATANGTNQIRLTWNASTDPESPSGISYTIARNGTPVVTTINVLTYTDGGLTADTTYQYTITAKNSVNLTSGVSTASAKTDPAPDTTKPSVPQNLNGSAVNSSQINLTWNASTDTGGSGLAGYNVYRGGSKINTNLVTSTSYGDSGLTASTAYSYTVAAVDGAGNESDKSAAKSITTQSGTVSTACNATVNPGSLSSVASAFSSLPSGGTLCLRGGTYTGSGVTLSKSGTSSARLTIKSYPGETAVMDAAGQSIGKTSDILTIGGSYVTFSDIEMKNSTGRALRATGSNILVSNNRIHDIQYNGILDTGTNNKIDGNKVWKTVLSNTNAVMKGSGWAEAINTWGANNSTISNNEIYDSWGEGIDFINSNGGVAEGNLVYRNYSVQIYLDGSSNVTVRNNKLGANIPGADRGVTGVLVASEGGGGIGGNIVTGNYFTGTPYYSTWNVPASGVTFSNNYKCSSDYTGCSAIN